MFKVIHLPTAEIVPIEEYRPYGYLGKEHSVRAYLQGHACIYNKFSGKPEFVPTGHTYQIEYEVPEHFLEVIEFPDV